MLHIRSLRDVVSDEKSKLAGLRYQAPLPLLFAKKPFSSPISLQWCDSWQRVTASKPPLSALYLPSSFWLSSNGETVNPLHVKRFQELLSQSSIKLWPPLAWDQLVERKDIVYSRLHEFMLPAQWILFSAVGGDVSKMKNCLIRWCQQRGNGRYFLKGCETSCGSCAEQITFSNGRFEEDVEKILREFQSDNQIGVGIQPFIPGFDSFEIRTFMVWDPFSKKWRSALTLKTALLLSKEFSVEQFAPLHGHGLLIAGMIDEMMEKRADFFKQIHDLGVPMLRIDCGFDGGNQRPFLSEFALAGDAQLWCSIHNQDLAYVIGRAMGDQLWNQMTQSI